VLSSSGSITDDVPPKNFVTMARACTNLAAMGQ
jgi:hypothetical protein